MTNTFRSHPKIRIFFILGVILIVTILSYAPIFKADFVNWDDQEHLLNNIAIRSLDIEHLCKMFTDKINQIYIPLTSLSFALEYHFFGFNPFVYHLDNLILHLFVVIFVFWFARKLNLSILAASMASLIFGIHPAHVESVAWVTERKDVLYAFFYMLALLMYLRYLEINKTESKKKILAKKFYGPLIAVTALGTLSMLAKPMALSIPLILFLLDWFKGRKIDVKAVLEKLPLIIFVLIIALVTYLANARLPFENKTAAFFIWPWTFVFYLRQFMFPFFSVPVQRIPQPIAIDQSEYFLSLIVFLLVIFVFWRLIKYRKEYCIARWFNFALIFFFASIFFLLRFDEPMNTNIVADRFMYLPMLGFCLLLGYGVEQLWKRQKANLGATFAVIIFVIIVGGAFCVRTYHLCQVWQNPISLWQEQLKIFPNEYIALNNLATALCDQEEFKKAEAKYKLNFLVLAKGKAENIRPELLGMEEKVEYVEGLFKKILEINPEFIDAQYNLAQLYKDIGRPQEALVLYQKVIDIDPYYKDVYFSVGNLFIELNKPQEAIEAYEQTIHTKPDDEEIYINVIKAYTKILKEESLNPLYLEARDKTLNSYLRVINSHRPKATSFFNLGCLYAEMGDLDKAIASYQKALAINPRYADVLYNLGNVYKDLGLLSEALSFYQQNIKINPWHGDAYINMGIIYGRQGNHKEARKYYQKVVNLNSKDTQTKAKAYFNLAYLEEIEGNQEKALEFYQKSIIVDPENAEGYYNLGNVYAGLRNYSEAINNYLKAVEKNPNHVNAWVNLSISAFQEQNFVEAVKYYDEAVLLGYVPPSEFAAAIAKYKK